MKGRISTEDRLRLVVNALSDAGVAVERERREALKREKVRAMAYRAFQRQLVRAFLERERALLEWCLPNVRKSNAAEAAWLEVATVGVRLRAIVLHVGRFGKYRCFYCGVETLFGCAGGSGAETGSAATVDHIVSVRSGGSDAFDNVLLACRSCNSRKGRKSIGEFLPI